MISGLKIGDRLLTGDQVISALVQYKLLDALIGHVLLDEAIQAIAVSKQEVFQWLSGTPHETIPEDFDAYVAQWCAARGVTSVYFKSVMLREWRVEKFKQHYFDHQLESEFLQSKSWFDQVEYSLVQVDNAALAQELYYQLRDDGIEFARLVATYSLGDERTTGGRVGPVPLATLPAPVIPFLQGKNTGIVQKPIQVGDRYWIVRLEQFTAARLTEATRQTLIDRLFDHWLRSKVEALRATPGAIAMQSDVDMSANVASMKV